MRINLITTVLLITLLLSCNKKKDIQKQFSLLEPEQTKLFFKNKLTEGPNTNVLLYEYLYNGGGVALADFNGYQRLDIYLSSNMEDNKLYLNRGKLEFEDISEI